MVSKKIILIFAITLISLTIYSVSVRSAFSDDIIGIILNDPITVSNYIFTGLSPFWEVSGGFLIPNETETGGTSQVRVSLLNATDNVTTPEICLNGDCQTAWPGGISAESDPYWTGNYTACSSSQKLYFDGVNLACNDDQLGGGGTGAPHWIDGGTYLYPNSSYADDVLITGDFYPEGVINQSNIARYNLLDETKICGNPQACYDSGYTLSVQSTSASTWLEILNSGGAGEGAFFGMSGTDFEVWNYQGGSIQFYTNPSASAGTLRLEIENGGNFDFQNNQILTSSRVKAGEFTIGSVTLDNNEWGYLDDQDQEIKTTSSPTFAELNATYNVTTPELCIDGWRAYKNASNWLIWNYTGC